MLKPVYLIAIVALCSMGNFLHAQNLSGKWYGVGYVQLEGSTDSYLAELILKQDDKQVKGEFNYYFKDKFFKNKIEGSFDKASRVFTLKKIPVIFYRSNDTKRSVESIMSGSFELRVSKVSSILNGLLISTPENQYIVPTIKYRFLRSMGEPVDTTAEDPAPLLAYQEKHKTAMNSSKPVQLNNQNSVDPNKSNIETKSSNTETNQSNIETNKTTVQLNTGNTNPAMTKAATLATTTLNSDSSIAVAKAASIPFINTRKKAYFKEIDLDNPKIQVEVYDNGTIDYDSVSLYLNGKEVLVKTMLNHRSVKISLQLDPNLEYNELSMFAENLGMIPPNTAAMIIHDGKKDYQVMLQSDLSKSATLKLKVKKNNQ